MVKITPAEQAELERELAEVQAEFLEAVETARRKRQDVVMRARQADISKYRIAQVMGVKGATIDSIIDTAQRRAD